MLRSAKIVGRIAAGKKVQQVQRQKRNVHAYTSVGKRVVTLIPGDGIGPEITSSVVGIIQASGAPVEFERFDLDPVAPFPEALLMRFVAETLFLDLRNISPSFCLFIFAPSIARDCQRRSFVARLFGGPNFLLLRPVFTFCDHTRCNSK